jgi:hypothetical protein
VEDRPSERVIEQRLHNRVLESLEILARGDDGVRELGNADYVNQFFDWIDDEAPWDWRAYSTWTPSEVAELDEVQQQLRRACDETPRICTDEEFISSGWPERVAPVAVRALAVLRQRRWFREDAEEDSPSNPSNR